LFTVVLIVSHVFNVIHVFNVQPPLNSFIGNSVAQIPHDMYSLKEEGRLEVFAIFDSKVGKNDNKVAIFSRGRRLFCSMPDHESES
jgi:hypothetical protein